MQPYDFKNTVFNYPTLAECYKTAAFNGLNRLSWPQVSVFAHYTLALP
jgi:hypothetical protein